MLCNSVCLCIRSLKNAYLFSLLFFIYLLSSLTQLLKKNLKQSITNVFCLSNQKWTKTTKANIKRRICCRLEHIYIILCPINVKRPVHIDMGLHPNLHCFQKYLCPLKLTHNVVVHVPDLCVAL